jgi:hypothetical protein
MHRGCGRRHKLCASFDAHFDQNGAEMDEHQHFEGQKCETVTSMTEAVPQQHHGRIVNAGSTRISKLTAACDGKTSYLGIHPMNSRGKCLGPCLPSRTTPFLLRLFVVEMEHFVGGYKLTQ